MTPEKDEGLVGAVETVKGQAAAGAQGDSVGLVKLSCKRDHCLQRGLGFFTYTNCYLYTLLFFLYLTETRGSRD